jgi:hypothetical protein
MADPDPHAVDEAWAKAAEQYIELLEDFAALVAKTLDTRVHGPLACPTACHKCRLEATLARAHGRMPWDTIMARVGARAARHGPPNGERT